MPKPRIKFDEKQKQLLMALYEIGCKDIEVASVMKLSLTVLKRAIDQNGIRDAIKEVKGIADRKVEMSLYRQAVRGNITACIFWLCNRQREKWAHVNKELGPGDTNGSINVVVIKDAGAPKQDKSDVIEIEAGQNEKNTD